MLISTKGRYALRVMIDLAEHQSDGFIPLKVGMPHTLHVAGTGQADHGIF